MNQFDVTGKIIFPGNFSLAMWTLKGFILVMNIQFVFDQFPAASKDPWTAVTAVGFNLFMNNFDVLSKLVLSWVSRVTGMTDEGFGLLVINFSVTFQSAFCFESC
jgi:hypothetical protein